METDKNEIVKHKIHGKSKGFHFLLFLTAFLFLIDTGCKKDPFDFDRFAKNQTDPSTWCMPVVHGKLLINDLINDSTHLTQNDNGLIKFVYNGSITSLPILEYLNPGTIKDSNDFSFEMPEYVPPGDTVFVPCAQNVNFELLEDQRLEKTLFKSCKIQFNFSTDLNKDATLVITIPSAVKDGIAYSKTINYHYQTSGTITETIDLSGYDVTFSHQGSQYNLLRIESNVYVISNEEPDNSPYTFHFAEHISDISLQNLYGYAGQIEFPVYTDTIFLNIFTSHLQGSIDFANPHINIIAENGVGAPAGLTFVSLKAHYPDISHETIEVEGTGLPDEWIINYPETENQFALTQLELNKDNSNIRDIIKYSPDYFVIKIRGEINPDGNIIENFANENSTVTLTAGVELPMFGSTNNLVLEDNYGFYFEENVQEIEKADFNIVFTNAFPLDVAFQVYFLDSSNNVLDSLFTSNPTIEHGKIDAQTLRMIEPAKTVFKATVTPERLNNIKHETTALKIHASLKTPYENPVKIFSDNYLGFQIGVKYHK